MSEEAPLAGIGLHPLLERPLPVRYELREDSARTLLVCKELPGVRVSVDRAHAFGESEAQKLGPRTILLDGVGQFRPLIDNARQLYNFDHHEHVLRSFTLATCEQALVMVLKGLELDKGDWIIYANEPDLDTILAIWVLVNQRRVRSMSPEGRDRLAPLLRLEGAIDANGAEIGDWCGLPVGELERARGHLGLLFEREQSLKRKGIWREIDLPEFTLRMLGEIDRLVYSPEELGEVASVEHEYGHVDIGRDRIAIVVRDSGGIYEVERKLRSIWGDRLGLVALYRDRNEYTLRRTGLSDVNLEIAYERLNALDPAVNGRPREKRWGGSDEIGGSPRPGGSRLEPGELLRVLAQCYATAERPPRLALRALALSLLLTLASAAVGPLAIMFSPVRWLDAIPPMLPFAGAAFLLSATLTVFLSGRRPWLYGFRATAGGDWSILIPIVLACGLLGASWAPWLRTEPEGLDQFGFALAACLAGALASEAWFRGFVHGLGLSHSPVQQVGGRWFVSRANWISAALYAAFTAGFASLLLAGSPLRIPSLFPGQAAVLCGAAALAAGLSLGAMRERSKSLWPGVIAQFLAAALALLAHHPLGRALLRSLGV